VSSETPPEPPERSVCAPLFCEGAMVRELYRRMESTHWWFRARRSILLERLARRVAPDSRRLVVEIGCATGGNLEYIARRYRAIGIEPDAATAERARRKSGAEVLVGALPEAAELIPAATEAVRLFDLMEHLDDDAGALAAVAGRMRVGSWLLATVPAFPALWSRHDVALGHRRRYTATAFRTLFESCGFRIEKLSYFQTLLFPLALFVRHLRRAHTKVRPQTDFSLPPRAINKLIETVFAWERYLLRVMNLPVGLSLLVEARRREDRASEGRT